MSTLVGSKLDKYEVLSEVGHGGMAVVYRGRDTVLDREVAIKVLHPHLADREESRRRLRREALTVAKLRHENILEIFDYSGEDANESYIVTEFIHGVTLREWLDTRWRPRPALAALVTHRLCEALANAHRGGVIHRDLKPENVMIRQDGVLKLMDFGIAQIIDHEKLTMTGQLLGSPAYMAPELINGKPVDNRTDLFALGIILFQLATGSLPFSGRNPHEVLTRIADADYPEPATICPLVDDDLAAVIHRALSRDPAERFQSADAFASELAAYLSEVDIEAGANEVKAYFSDPERYVSELDDRVCAALMKRAEAASNAGHSARAIRLLGRVLELEEDQKQAVQMLSRLRTRERRLRKLALVGSGLLGFGVVSAGVVYVLLAPPDPSRLPPEPDRVGNVDRDDVYRLMGDAKAVDKRGRPPRAAGTDSDASDSSASSGPSHPGRDDTKTKSPTASRTPAPKIARCTLKIDGLPTISARHHTLLVNNTPVELTGSTIPLELTRERTQIQLSKGPYTGQLLVFKDKCRPGATIVLKARQPQAILKFPNIGGQTVIDCSPRSLCPRGRYLASSFPNLDLEGNQAVIELVFKAKGFKPLTVKRTIHPGPNVINVTLEPR